ncbi:MAG: thiamine diphosphokinase [Clostridiales bacterium]|nr:thiamine diphosphokinase [Clostridiales bacterium]
MKILIITGGHLGDVDYIKENSLDWDFIICADVGARHLQKLGIKPDLLVGDFDSISPELLQKYKDMGVAIQTYPKAKDRTDTHIAVDIAIDMGAKLVYMIGALGSRWDHSFANIMLLYRLELRGIRAKILHSQNTIMLINNILEIEGQVGQILSLIPFSEEVHVEYTRGLAYPLNNDVLTSDFPLGISNVLEEEKAVVKVKKGWLIGVLAKD